MPDARVVPMTKQATSIDGLFVITMKQVEDELRRGGTFRNGRGRNT